MPPDPRVTAAVLAALGLAPACRAEKPDDPADTGETPGEIGCADTAVTPCLGAPIETGDTGVGPCLDVPAETGDTSDTSDSGDSGDTADTAETGDTAVGPCLTAPRDTADTSDTAPDTRASPRPPRAAAGARRVLDAVLSRGVLPEDVAARLRKK